jgi:predicted amidohydrolase YtcJ
MAARIAELGGVVVSQPAFVRQRGDRYLRLLAAHQVERLYAFRTLIEAGVPIAAGSDAPVTRPEPLASVAAAVDRAAASGATIGSSQAVETLEALRWWTSGAAHAAFLEAGRGILRHGAIADLVLLPQNALLASAEDLRDYAPVCVWRRGEQVMLDSG